MRQFKRLASDAKGARVAVGYECPYAVYVHENMEAFHAVGTAKYLERPARRLRRAMGELAALLLKKQLPLRETLLVVGTLLLRVSQELVPVRTGRLKASGFVEVDDG